MQRKVFTVEEANSLLPAIRDVFGSIDYYKTKIREQSRKLEVLSLLWEGAVADTSNPDYEAYVAGKKSIEDDVGQIEQLVRDEIVRRGIRFPNGGIENGLLDFPTTYEGRWVYLCWQNGEPELLYWHETNAGFPGRQRITDEQRRSMGQPSDPESLDDSALDF